MLMAFVQAFRESLRRFFVTEADGFFMDVDSSMTRKHLNLAKKLLKHLNPSLHLAASIFIVRMRKPISFLLRYKLNICSFSFTFIGFLNCATVCGIPKCFSISMNVQLGTTCLGAKITIQSISFLLYL